MAGRRNALVPEGWRTVCLGEVADIQKGVSFTSKELVPGDVPVVAGGREPAYYHNSSNRPAGTVTVSASGAYAGFVAFHNTPILATDCTTVRARPALSDTTFVFHALKQSEALLYQRRSGSAHPHVYPRDIAALSVLFPPLSEQRAIAAVLDSIDEAIERTEEVIVATERLRDALLHELLTRGLPGRHTAWRDVRGLGTIPADWEVVRLGERIADGPTNGLYKPESEYGSGTWLIRIDDFVSGALVRSRDFKRVRATETEKEQYALTEGDILINRVNSLSHIGKSVLLPRLDEPTMFESNMMRVRMRSDVNLGFVARVLLSTSTRRHFVARAKKAVQQASINQDDVGATPLPLPPLPEQRAIAAALDSVDAAIERARAERAALRSSKASTADALLTGRVRVPTTGVDA